MCRVTCPPTNSTDSYLSDAERFVDPDLLADSDPEDFDQVSEADSAPLEDPSERRITVYLTDSDSDSDGETESQATPRRRYRKTPLNH